MQRVPETDPLDDVCVVLRTAFPSGKPDKLYRALLFVLTEEMSFRAVARAIETVFGIDRIQVEHDSYGVRSVDEPAASDVDAVRELLKRHGYYQLDQS